jgi:hypothetical protein
MAHLSSSRISGVTAALFLSLPFVAACGLFDGVTSDDDTSASSGGGSTDIATPTTGEPIESGPPVNLGTAGNYVILAKTGISTASSSDVTGDLGVSPTAASYITGFALTEDATNTFSTSMQVNGRVFASDYEPPTPANLTTAVGDMETAFTDAAGRAADVVELGAGDIGGMVLTAGVYKWSTGVLVPTDVTLTGSPTDVWIFQIAEDLTVANATDITLTGGALAQNVFWQVTGQVSVGTTASFEGVILTEKSVTLKTGASVHGRVLAQTKVALDQNVVGEPNP